MTAFLLKSYVRTHPITLLLKILRGRIHGPSPHSSGVTAGTTSLYMQPLALHWLSALYIALRWLPIALIWLPTTRFFISRAPNMITRLDVELQPLHRLPALAP